MWSYVYKVGCAHTVSFSVICEFMYAYIYTFVYHSGVWGVGGGMKPLPAMVPTNGGWGGGG